MRLRLTKTGLATSLVSGLTSLILLFRHGYPHCGPMTTFLLLLAVFGGMWLINSVERVLPGANVKYLHIIHAIRVPTLMLLLGAWTPSLMLATAQDGYDPQRYYHQAVAYATDGAEVEQVEHLAYPGVVTYYTDLLKVFGTNPAVPAIANSLTSLFGAMCLILVLGHRFTGPGLWMAGLYLLLPDILWFDVMPCRETLSTSLLIMVICGLGYPEGFASWISKRNAVCGGLTAAILLGVVRLPMIVPAFAAVAGCHLLGRRTSPNSVALLLAASAVFFLLVPALNVKLGGIGLDIGDRMRWAHSQGLRSEWQPGSVGEVFAGRTQATRALFAPIRMASAIVAPVPDIRISVSALANGSASAWQNASQTASGLVHLLLIPLAIVGAERAMRMRATTPPFGPLALVSILTAIAMGISYHERYRVMAVPFLWTCIWLSGQSTSRRRLLYSMPYAMALSILVVAYYAYKGAL